MANFQRAAARVLALEGGYQANTNDQGNYNSLGQNVGTNYGVSARLYEDWIKRPPTVADMKAITKNIAIAIYRQRFWDRIQGDFIKDQAIAELIFDGVINHGVYRGVQLLQKVLGVAQDGKFGTETLAVLNRANPQQVYNALRQSRISFYNQIVRNDPTQTVFLKGWLKRIDSFKDYTISSSVGIFFLLALFGWYWYQKSKA